MITPRIIEAKYLDGYKLYLRYADGSEGEINLETELTGEIFYQLRKQEYFKNFEISQDLNTVVWPNGADFSPEFLYQKIHSNN
jgi:hypothetical protein